MTYQPTISTIQRQILEHIQTSVSERGFPPSVREIGLHVGLTSTSSVHHQLKQLELKGYLKRMPGCSRAISVHMPGSVAA